jgi:hypothetical protein
MEHLAAGIFAVAQAHAVPASLYFPSPSGLALIGPALPVFPGLVISVT